MPLLSPEGTGGGESGNEGEEGKVDEVKAEDFDSATEELIGLLTGSKNEDDDTPAEPNIESGDEDAPKDREETEVFNIPVDDTSQKLDEVKKDIIEELKSILPKPPEEDNVGDEEEKKEESLKDKINSEEFMQKYLENPLEAITDLANIIAADKVANQMEELKKQLSPVMEQAQQIEKNNQVRQVLTEFMTSPEFADAGDFQNEIADFVKNNQLPKDDINSYKEAYWRAKVNSLQNSAGKTLEEYLNDEDSVNQIAGNENIKNKIIEDYLKGVAQGQKPITLGADSYSPTANPATSLNSLDDAGAALSKIL